MRRQVARLILVGILGMSVGVPLADAAPPPPQDKKPVLLIHGYQKSGVADCNETWGAARKALEARGREDLVKTVAYYTVDDTNCDISLNGRYGRNADVRTLGRALAWSIYRRYTKRDKSVDIIAHSMGGLVARTAITGVEQRWRGYPPRLYVEDAVTLGTPHSGVRRDATFLRGCLARQCAQMRPGSSFLKLLERYQNPQASEGTDWTLIGSASDKTVLARSATKTRATNGAMIAGHYVGFTPSAGISHGELRTATGAQNLLAQWRNRGSGWQTSSLGRSPILWADFAITSPGA